LCHPNPFQAAALEFAMAGAPRSKLVVHAALIGNLLVALTKFIAAGWTGSSAMLSEAVHSLVDTGDQAVLLYGMHRAARPPDEARPLGYGRELYFWSFIVALLMFTVGAGVTLYEGIDHIRAPQPIEQPIVNYIVLGLAGIFEGATWAFALREFRKSSADIGLLEAARRSKDPPAFIVLFEDTAALIGLIIAFVGTAAAQYFEAPILDGAASIAISALLGCVALLLARESKGLLMGEPASKRTREDILRVAGAIPGIEDAQVLFTVHLAPDQIVAALNVEFDDRLTTPEIEDKVAQLERALHAERPDLIALFVRPYAIEENGRRRAALSVTLPGRFDRARRAG
jgi:cation diffusion facilitator family transporter